MPGIFKVDNIEFTNAVVDEPERSFQILDGKNAGRLQGNLRMERDVRGTFYNYKMNIDSEFMTQEEYSTLYNLLSAPVNSHILEVPFNQETLTFEAYITSGVDKVTRIDEDGNHWTGLSINFVAMEPQRRPSE